DLALQALQHLIRLDADPDRTQPALVTEITHTRQGQREAWEMNGREGSIDVLRLVPLDLADEAQRQMQVLRRHPARAGQTIAESADLLAQRLGQGKGNEETHDRTNSLRLDKAPEKRRGDEIRDRDRCR